MATQRGGAGPVQNKISEPAFNSRTAATLAAGATFQGVGEDVSAYGRAGISVTSDNATDGTLTIEVSRDGVTWGGPTRTWADTRFAQPHMWEIVEKYFRIKYVNGTTEAINLAIQVHYSTNGGVLLGHQLDETLLDETEAIVVRSVSVGQDPAGAYKNTPTPGYAPTFSSVTPLSNGASFDSGITDITQFQYLKTEMHSDQDGTLVGTWYDDAAGSNVLRVFTLPYTAAEGLSNTATIVLGKYVRYTFTNDSGVDQTNFYFNMRLSNTPMSGQILTVDQFIPTNVLTQLTRSVISALKPDGTYQNIASNNAGALDVGDFATEVAKGDVTGHSWIRKFGRNPDIDTGAAENIWGNGGLFTFAPTAQTLNIKSTDNDDRTGQTGALTVEVYGLDSDYNEQTETVALNGTTNVLTVNSYLRLLRMTVKTAGSSGANEGILTAIQSTSVITLAGIQVGVNQTQLGHYTIPAGYTGYIYSFVLSASKSGSSLATITTQVRPFGEVFQIKGTYGVHSQAGTITARLDAPLKLTEKTDIKFLAEASANNTQVGIEYSILLVDNTL